MTLQGAALVLVAYAFLYSAFGWSPLHGVARKAAFFIVCTVVLIVVAVRYSHQPLVRSRNLAGWQSVSFAVGFVPVVCIFASSGVTWIVEHLLAVGPTGTYNDTPPDASTVERWLLWLTAVVCAVAFEEILYRGAMLSTVLDTARSLPLALIVSSATWGLAHGGAVGGYNAAQVAGIIATGAIVGWACYVTRSLAPGLATHLLVNLTAEVDDVRPWSTLAFLAGVAAVSAMLAVFLITTVLSRKRGSLGAEDASGCQRPSVTQ